ncbi:MAG: hypothetical protein AAF889_08225 [Cyanobacteria bacterium P01_D01_bin.73]
MGFDAGLKTLSETLLRTVVLGIATASVGLTFSTIAHAEPERSTYREVAPEEFEQRFFSPEIPAHLNNDSLYSIAIAVFGAFTGEREGRQSESIEIEYDREGGAIATVTAIGLADDSVSAVRVRMDFTQDAELGWQLVWVGTQQQCGRGRNPDVWTTNPCP